ncbi:MAG: hypothetical protein KJ847_04055, partial [Firmicutes bacterium]|nr:hypothetical protein [Bacillota bacterium]
MLALEIREKEINSAMYNLESGDENKAKKEIESAINMLKIVQSKATPKITEEIRNNVEGTESKIRENENLNLEFFEKYLTEEQKTKLVIEHSEKILEYCEELAKQDYDLMLKDEKCQNNAPDWLEDEVNNRIDEVQKQDSEEIKKQIEITMNNPKEADCDGLSLTTERVRCEKFKALAVRCEFQDDESACEEIGMFRDVQNNERENYEQEILNKYVPAECTEAGIRDGEECKKFIISLYKPDSECMENGQVLDGEACGKKLVKEDKIPQNCIKNGQPVSAEECENVMKEKSKPSDEEFKLMSGECKERGVYDVEACNEIVNLPGPCKDAGHYTKKECESFTLNQNLPQECIDAGALTPEACEKIKLPSDCQGAYSREECETIKIEQKFPEECKLQDEFDAGKCAMIMVGENIVPTGAEMEYFVRNGLNIEEIPEVCMTGSTFIRSDVCDAELAKLGIVLPKPTAAGRIPKECMIDERTTVSPAECENTVKQTLVVDTIPQECQDAEVTNPEECGSFMEEKRIEQGIGINMPEECMGISIEECKKIMEEKGIKINKPEINQDKYYGICDEGEEDCGSEDIIKEGVPEECAKLGVYDKESCSLIMSKINVERIKDGDKVVIDDDGNTDIITNDQINQIADDADKKADDIKPDTTKADQIKQQVDDLADDIKNIQEPDGNNNDLENGNNVVSGDSDNNVIAGDDSGNGQVSGGDSASIDSGGSDAGGEDSVDSGGDAAPITGEVIR